MGAHNGALSARERRLVGPGGASLFELSGYEGQDSNDAAGGQQLDCFTDQRSAL